MRTQKVEAVVMEVSSHGLELGRVEGCRFRVGAFTNLTQDHLDFHETMDAYRDAKVLLFERHLADDGCAVINADDPAAPAFERAARETGAKLVLVSRDASSDADVALERAEVRMDGTSARVRLPSGPLDLSLPLLGDFNVENLLVACGISVALGTPPEAIAAGVASCPQVPGRVERIGIGADQAPTVLVDYAHTPDAVEKVLRTLRPHVHAKGTDYSAATVPERNVAAEVGAEIAIVGDPKNHATRDLIGTILERWGPRRGP
jgi:UDP-N-acetylmuramoyl-L-alanyl-D-glutamate--2,6-diaminopimelate ligase